MPSLAVGIIFIAIFVSFVDCMQPTDTILLSTWIFISFDIMLSDCPTWSVYIVEDLEKNTYETGSEEERSVHFAFES